MCDHPRTVVVNVSNTYLYLDVEVILRLFKDLLIVYRYRMYDHKVMDVASPCMHWLLWLLRKLTL
jgi:hypothetical protein